MKKILGIELGSTRIKSVLIDENGKVLATGSYQWENKLVNGHWSYSMDDVRIGLQTSYKELVKNYDKAIETLDAIGISAMMHGYLAFDKDWNLLEPFRTWRDTTTAQAAEILTEKLQFNMPQRWSSTHYFQAVLNKEKTVKKVAHLQTLAGYIHYLLTGKNVLGANDASGMFPLDGKAWDKERVDKYNALLSEQGVNADITDLLPEVLVAGVNAGTLTEDGAKYLDPTGTLEAGAIMCPPEGDMGTGMICTNSVKPTTAQVSSGTAANMSVVLEKPLKKYYKQIDIIATPDGHPCALIHTNNCTSEINEWVELFDEVIKLFGGNISKDKLYTRLFNKAAESDSAVGNLVGYNYLSGEPLAETYKGAPMMVRSQDGKLNLANFMQMQIYSAVAALSLGTDILKNEGVRITSVTAHGGYYKTPKIGQVTTSAALNAPVTVMSTAGEGGAYGIALLAGYTINNEGTLQEYLDKIFADSDNITLTADEKEQAKYDAFFDNYKKYLTAERTASEV